MSSRITLKATITIAGEAHTVHYDQPVGIKDGRVSMDDWIRARNHVFDALSPHVRIPQPPEDPNILTAEERAALESETDEEHVRRVEAESRDFVRPEDGMSTNFEEKPVKEGAEA